MTAPFGPLPTATESSSPAVPNGVISQPRLANAESREPEGGGEAKAAVAQARVLTSPNMQRQNALVALHI